MKFKRLFTVILAVLIIMTATHSAIADFGNFDTYDSSGWDSGSSWDSDWGSSWDSGRSSSPGYYYSDNDYYEDEDLNFSDFLIVIAVIAIIAFVTYKRFKGTAASTPRRSGQYQPTNSGRIISYPNKNAEISGLITADDPAFNTEKFLAYVNESYVKLQMAWCERDLEPVRLILSEEMFAQMTPGVDQYKRLGRINMMERMAVQESYLTAYSTDNEKETLSVYLYATQKDYIIDESTKQVLEGSSTDFRHSKYVLNFIRAKGNKTETHDGIKDTNCPNCGAPLEITSSGKCAYCDSVVTNEDHSWVLSSMKRVN